ncbi:MAG: hypothetical protein FWG35_06715 [Spirochaetaceae bacterium]|nr:hypothetical protein [Spirochaetaceae bacterium]
MEPGGIEVLKDIDKTLQRIAVAVEKQQPGKLDRVLTLTATAISIAGILSVLDIVFKWIGG